MLLTLKKGSKEKGIETVVNKVKELGFIPHVSKGENNVVVGVIGDNPSKVKDIFESMFLVESVTLISKPYKFVSRELKRKDTVVQVSPKVFVGGEKIVIMAGPCSIETKELMMKSASAVKKSGATVIRGGAFKPRTSPYSFQGMGLDGLKILYDVGRTLNIPIVTEAMTEKQVDMIIEYSDIIQIGARNVQNFDLLKHVGKQKKPVLLKRGMSTTIEEFLMSAEYIASQGNHNIILCERGIRTFETSTRFMLDISAVPVIKKLSHLPIIIDPSHAAGVREYVPALSKAAIAAGADGLIIEVHANPELALCDGKQALKPSDFDILMTELKKIAIAIDRKI